jgi:hypothetical protein
MLACTVNLATAQSHIWHMLGKICFTIILVGFNWGVFDTPCVKKWSGIFDTYKLKYASHVTYCPSLEATLSHCLSYLTLCRGRFTVWALHYKIICTRHGGVQLEDFSSDNFFIRNLLWKGILRKRFYCVVVH